MNICFPVDENRGLDSPLCPHFGSAPVFLIVDTETRATQAVVNADQHHAHGMCQPLAALTGQSVEALVVGGIGWGAYLKLQSANIQVFRAEHPTVAEALVAFAAGRLAPITRETACGHHGHGHDH
ncbi:MAG TPA: NifB/NifX family molybdenum-iron cluster-binding protein [Acidobacteriota bacterium]|nr:NifB/NifX family molybdenum-iron cluster-binding protein [Acidobacteriota bacterium]HQM62289.1 NifB/NifX family molybdenum-iron cluster-binding protein [Acidobacteriota bacterium]